ncbi:MAG: TonB-dependent receptor [Rhodoferax sp.]|nr:TonB-dependent receptor [Rhodoferax sp.]MCF8209329.1 TonB-dependent receptor [Rhodoferax sp.]
MKHFALTLVSLLLGTGTFAQEKALSEANLYYQKSLDELMHIETPSKAEVGSRSGARDALEAEVPVDVITAAQLESSGFTELSKALIRLIPGFNSPRPTGHDGTDHVPPFTLRGLNPDQVLVLVNGKRLHQSSLLNVNFTVGRGTSGVDINTIPLRSIERIEVLRDGAAAQYGSDAIAGIINIILKGYGHRSSVSASYGRTTAGDGAVRQVDGFYALPLKNDGFINLSAENRDRERTNRAGPDPRFSNRINHFIGETAAQDGQLSVNAELPTESLTFYAHGLLDRRSSSASALYRLPTDARNNTVLYPNGFLPMIEPKISDYSFSAGVRGVSANDVRWDLSLTRGANDFHFYVANSHNDSLGNSSPTSFDSGATTYTQNILNWDLVKKYGALNLAGGAELRQENYQISRGEVASYVLGTVSNISGAQGFPGFMPQNEVSADRSNRALYLDARYDVSRTLSVEGATRYENYSDFGANLDKKLALAYRPHEDLLLRASASTGFRAPSLSQAYYTSTVSTLNGTDLSFRQAGTFAVNHPVSIALGAKALRPETSHHQTLGLVYQPTSDFSVSADFFAADIADRIMLTGTILETVSPQAKAILAQYGVQSARYFTNAIATETKGLDLRLNYKHTFENRSKLKMVASYHRDQTTITDVYPLASILGNQTQTAVLNDSSRSLIETVQPADGIKLWTQVESGNWRSTLNLNRVGSYYYVTGESFGAKLTADLDLAWQMNKSVEIAIGGNNIFDLLPDKWPAGTSLYSSGNGIVQYPAVSPTGYNGAFFYLRLSLKL